MFRPKFNTLYREVWPYPSNDGVGIKFTGTPTDRQAVIDLMWNDFSCHPKVGEIILDEMQQTGFRNVTVMSHLDFDELALRLLELGVKITIISPAPCLHKFTNLPMPPEPTLLRTDSERS